VVWPVLVLAYFLSILTFALYDVCATWARPGVRRLVIESVDEIAYGVLRANGSFTREGLSIIVKGVDGQTLLQPVITVMAGANNPAVTLSAKQASLRADSEKGLLQIECRDGQVDVGGEGSFRFPDEFSHEVVLHKPAAHPENHLSPAALASRVVLQQIVRERQILDQQRERLASLGEEQKQARARYQEDIEGHQRRLFRLEAEIPRRMANGFGCLCFVLVGVPIAMRSRSSDTMSIFFQCFLPILLVYYPLLVTGEKIARAGFHPQLSVWLADAVLLVAGVLLIVRNARH
jgi:lipopolysaccharide export system permease protein